MKRPLAKLELTVTGGLLLAGAWLAVSPPLVGDTGLQVASWHNALAGLAVIALAVLQHTALPPVGPNPRRDLEKGRDRLPWRSPSPRPTPPP